MMLFLQKCHVNIFYLFMYFLHLHIAIPDIRGHVTISLQIKVACYVCTE